MISFKGDSNADRSEPVTINGIKYNKHRLLNAWNGHDFVLVVANEVLESLLSRVAQLEKQHQEPSKPIVKNPRKEKTLKPKA